MHAAKFLYFWTSFHVINVNASNDNPQHQIRHISPVVIWGVRCPSVRGYIFLTTPRTVGWGGGWRQGHQGGAKGHMFACGPNFIKNWKNENTRTRWNVELCGLMAPRGAKAAPRKNQGLAFWGWDFEDFNRPSSFCCFLSKDIFLSLDKMKENNHKWNRLFFVFWYLCWVFCINNLKHSHWLLLLSSSLLLWLFLFVVDDICCNCRASCVYCTCCTYCLSHIFAFTSLVVVGCCGWYDCRGCCRRCWRCWMYLIACVMDKFFVEGYRSFWLLPDLFASVCLSIGRCLVLLLLVLVVTVVWLW